MNFSFFTVEEQELMRAFEYHSKKSLILELQRYIESDLVDPEISRIGKNTIKKLNSLSEKEFADVRVCLDNM